MKKIILFFITCMTFINVIHTSEGDTKASTAQQTTQLVQLEHDKKRLLDAIINNDKQIYSIIDGLKHCINLPLNKENETALIIALRLKNSDLAHHLIGIGADIHAQAKTGTALHLAVFHGLLNIIQKLIHRCPENQRKQFINCRDLYGISPFLLACQYGYLQIAQFLLKQEADINAAKTDRSTPFYYACQNGHIQIVQFLLEHNANIDAPTEVGITPLIIACVGGHTQIVELLLEHQQRPEVNALTNTNRTALHVASQKNHPSIAKLLLENNANPHIQDQSGKRPIDFAKTAEMKAVFASYSKEGDAKASAASQAILAQQQTTQLLQLEHDKKRLLDAIIHDDEEIYSIIDELKHCIDLPLNKENETALILASRLKKPGLAYHLIEIGADIHAQSTPGINALYYAAFHGLISLAKELIRRCPENKRAELVNCQNPQGLCPLRMACDQGHIQIVQLLLDNKADINAVAKVDGGTALHSACYSGHTHVVQLLLKHNADINAKMQSTGASPLYCACEKGHIEVVKLLLEDPNIDINAAIHNGITSLFSVCEDGHTQIVELLLQHKNININARSDDGSTPLYIACLKGHTQIAKLLLERNADVDAAKKTGATPLFMACQENNTQIAKLLLEHNADINAARSNGSTPLFIACTQGHVPAVRLLLDHRPNLNALTSIKTTALHIASERNALIVKLLLAHGANPYIQDTNRKKPADYAKTPAMQTLFASHTKKMPDQETQQIHAHIIEQGLQKGTTSRNAFDKLMSREGAGPKPKYQSLVLPIPDKNPFYQTDSTSSASTNSSSASGSSSSLSLEFSPPSSSISIDTKKTENIGLETTQHGASS